MPVRRIDFVGACWHSEDSTDQVQLAVAKLIVGICEAIEAGAIKHLDYIGPNHGHTSCKMNRSRWFDYAEYHFRDSNEELPKPAARALQVG
eukprot:CAMPEP_0119339134 /NCGR_PEP_ID=MMETSP1333-20130426/97658_1 /TAXON_ID=418940 /ORGANISM="Scyphosphaera apsteinii, Strain RCC1455" /LENGTH=90 /DNA_ID=CAMNT_0007350611 /DNA_START=29 /DNA_END=297 /DNA_ORIENTATION=-